MAATSRTSTGNSGWFLLLVVTTGLALVAFWVLLGQRFSPENYEVAPIVPDNVEFILLGAALALAAGVWVVSIRHREAWRRLALGALPVTAASLWLIAKTLLMSRIRMHDMLLFCVTGGWTTFLWMRNPSVIGGRTIGIFRALAWSLVIVTAVCEFRNEVRYLNDFALGYADCGENARFMFNSMTNPHKLFLRVNPDKPLFYDHINVGIIPFLPLWLLWPDLKLTIVLEIVAVFGVTVPLYFLAKRALQNEFAALLIVVAWMLYPATSQFIYSASYGFRWGNMCLLLYFVALALWVCERRAWALVFAVWAMLIKEEAAIVIGMFGIYLAVFERRKVAGTTLAAGSFGYFLLATSVLIPAAGGQGYAMTRFFFDLGKTKWEILLSPLVKPMVFWGRLVEPTSLYFAAALLAPLLFLPLRKIPVLLVGALTFVFCCMNPILKSISFHYQAALLPVVFWALIRALQDSDSRRRLGLLLGVVVSCATASLFLGALPWSKETLATQRMPGRPDLVGRFRSQIDPQGSLFATQRVAAHFVTQRYLYLDLPVPDQIDYALLDMRDAWRGTSGNLQWLERLRVIQREVEANPNLRLVAADDGLLFYSRRGTPLDRQQLVERDDLPAAAARVIYDLGGSVKIVGLETELIPTADSARMDCLRVTAYFTLAAPTNSDLAVRCTAHLGTDPEKVQEYASEYQPLGQSVWPMDRWQTDKYYADVFILRLPAGLSSAISAYSFRSLKLSR